MVQIGYRVTRLFWSTDDIYDRVRYECIIGHGEEGTPEFRVTVLDNGTHFAANAPTTAWTQILQSIAELRSNSPTDTLRFFPKQISGEYLFGFLEPAISKMLESVRVSPLFLL